MPRFKPYDYSQLQMVPVSLEQQLVPGTLEYAIHHLIEERFDTTLFEEGYRNDETGRRAFNPKVLLKIVLFGYSRGLMSSRRLEQACRENITFMALSCGQAPDHSTLAPFLSEMGEERIVNLFAQVLLVCEEDGLLGGTHFSLDGVKLSANASKEWSGTHEELRKKKEKLEQKVKEAIREHRDSDQRGGDRDGERQRQRLERLDRNVKRIEKFLAETPPKEGKGGTEIRSNVTDNDSAKMATSHGVMQAYNANALVDSQRQVIVHAEVFGEGEDASNMAPMLEGGRRNLQAVGRGEEPLKEKVVSADCGYFSVKNLEACQAEKVDAYIPDPHFRERDPRFENARRFRRPTDKHKDRYRSKKRWFDVHDFRFDDRTKKLICPAGHALYISSRNFEVGGYKAVAYRSPKTACRNCTLRLKCLRNPNSPFRQVHIFYGKRPGSITDAMRAKIDTPEGRATYGRRLAIVEPVFANLRARKRLDRFTLRGRLKVNIQWMLYCLVHNIEKLANFGTSFAMAH
jgi:transposase